MRIFDFIPPRYEGKKLTNSLRYNDAHHYRAENPLSHLHEDEAPVRLAYQKMKNASSPTKPEISDQKK